jgi:hypothetical protein
LSGKKIVTVKIRKCRKLKNNILKKFILRNSGLKAVPKKLLIITLGNKKMSFIQRKRLLENCEILDIHYQRRPIRLEGYLYFKGLGTK